LRQTCRVFAFIKEFQGELLLQLYKNGNFGHAAIREVEEAKDTDELKLSVVTEYRIKTSSIVDRIDSLS